MSIIKAKTKLPMDFIEALYAKFPERTANKILEGMVSRKTTLRVNTLKGTKEEVINVFNENNIEFEEVEWFDSAFVISLKNEKDIQALDIYKEGKIYLQTLSSMVPPIALGVNKGEKVLDLTAAPGSKTTEIACFMENEGEIVANEIDKIRAERLKHNIEMQGVKIATVINSDGRNVSKEYKEYFDKVLLDTPCSGEGRFVVSKPETYKSWSPALVNGLVKMQRELIDAAFWCLKPGGTLVYSTCTLNMEENEKMVAWAASNYGLEIESIDLKIPGSIKGNSKGISKDVEKTIKIIPSENMEGFYIAKLRKI